MAPTQPPAADDESCRVCQKDSDEEFLVLCDGCDRAFHTYCHNGCAHCHEKPKGTFNRKPAVPDGDWFCKFCAGHLEKEVVKKGAKPVSSVFVWGDNEDGQLAIESDKHVCEPTRVHALDHVGVLQLACGETFTLALCNDGNVYSVGTGPIGQLGHQDVVHEKLTKFRKLEALTEEKRTKNEGRIANVYVGNDFSVMVTEHGHVYTWGNGEVGQLGHQENKNKKAPKKISALRELEIPVDLACCGQDFVLFTSKDTDDNDQFNTKKPGVFMSMGGNAHGQLADGTGRHQWVPQLINKDAPSLTSNASKDVEEPSEFLLGRDIRLLAAGKGHCAALVNGTKGLWTWGFGEFGQLGHPKPEIPAGQSRFFRQQYKVPRPRFVKALEDHAVAQVACGGNFTLVVTTEGRLFGMGDNSVGQLGIKRASESDAEANKILLPVEIPMAQDAGKLKQITCGDEFAAALTANGGVYTWGQGQYGQLGLGNDQLGPIDTPTKVRGLPAIKKLYTGPNQVFAIEFTNETYIAPKPSANSSAAAQPAKKAANAKKRGRPGASASASKKKKK